jgi:uncharacterized protein YbjT (DUF2867 family)
MDLGHVQPLVVGASGRLGTEVCRELARAGKQVRALVRNSTGTGKQEALKKLGVSLVYGDLKDPSTLEAACRGVSAVISTATSTISRQTGDSIETVDVLGQLNLVQAAKAAGVCHFIFISFPPVATDFALQRAKRAVEKELVESNLVYTILQPAFLTETWLGAGMGFDSANARATIYGSGENKTTLISYLDVAKFAAASVDNVAARNSVIRLGGPDALSPLQMVQIFEEVAERRFTVTHVPEEALRAQQAAAADSVQEAFAALALSYAKGEVIDMEPAFRIFSTQALDLLSVRQYALRLPGRQV